jgi:hypothetical protein
MAQRQSAISYRDSVLYDDFVTHKAQFPVSSLMTHGIIKGQANMLGGNKEQIEDFRDEVVHYYSVGNMMYELYISPDILSPEEMDVLGNVTKWAEANAHPLLDNSTMVLGDPAKREPYGYVHSIPAKSIITLRNPFVRPQTVKLNVDEQNGFQKFAGEQVLEVQYPYRKVESLGVKFGQTLTFNLDAYEEIVAELRPGTGEQLPASIARLAGKDISFSPAALYRNSDSIRLSTTLNVPGDYTQARIAVLLEPNQETRGITAAAQDGDLPLELTTENGNRGVWYWFYANLRPGLHDVELTIHSSAPARVSAWLLTRRNLGTPAAASLLPAQSNIERGTHLLLEETIRQ